MNMVIKKDEHKGFLYKLFFDITPQGQRPKNFPIDKLICASSAAKKLIDGAETKENTVIFTDGKVEFTADEWVILKDLLKAKKTGTINEAIVIEELKEIFEI